MKCLAVKLLHEIFYNSEFKKYNCNTTHGYNENIWVDIPHQTLLKLREITNCGKCVISGSKVLEMGLIGHESWYFFPNKKYFISVKLLL